MAQTTKIRYQKQDLLGKSLILPELGQVEIPLDGVLEVPATLAIALLKGADWELADTPSEVSPESLSVLDSLSLEEIKTIAIEAGLSVEEIERRSASKTALSAYLANVLGEEGLKALSEPVKGETAEESVKEPAAENEGSEEKVVSKARAKKA